MDKFIGPISYRDDDDYEAARIDRVFNARRPRRLPAAILQAECDADVVRGVLLARERGWKVSIRSGGHSWPAWSVRDDALLIDLGRMRDVELDASSGVVSVRPAVTGGELLPYLAEHGLMFQTGHAPDVGLGGFLLQGGVGWNCRGWGWACERIRSLDVVTADGELVRADANHNADLLWAARGAGHGFFGVVTRFELETRPLPAAITQSMYIYPPEAYDEIMPWLLGLQASIAPIVEFGLIAAHGPDGHPALVVYALALAETTDDAMAALAPFEDCPVLEQALTKVVSEPTTLEDQFANVARQNPSDLRYLADSARVNAGPAETAAALRNAFIELPTDRSESLWMAMAPQRPLPDMAFSLQADSYFATFPKCADVEGDRACESWLAARMQEVEPVSEGVFLGDSDLAVRPAPFLSPVNLLRLEELRGQRDPDGLFCSYMTADDLAAAAGSHGT